MKAYEIFRRLSSTEIDAFVLAACEDDEIPEKIAGGILTYQRIPLTRLERAPEEVRKGLVRKTLRDKRGADLALYVLSGGLTRGSARLVEAFLEALGLPHDGPNLTAEGSVPEPSADALKGAVELLLRGFDARTAAIYLHAFSSQPDVAWPGLDALLASDPRLALEDRSAA